MKYRLYLSFIEEIYTTVEAGSKEEAERKGYELIKEHCVYNYENPDVEVEELPSPTEAQGEERGA